MTKNHVVATASTASFVTVGTAAATKRHELNVCLQTRNLRLMAIGDDDDDDIADTNGDKLPFEVALADLSSA